MTFYPQERRVPQELHAPRFTARPLRAVDAAIDHEAFVASPDTIRIHSGGHWPTENFTVADNVVLAAQHEERHTTRQDFAFLLLDLTKTVSLGCFYLLPLQPFLEAVKAPESFQTLISADAVMATFWVRQSERGTGLDREVVATVQHWLETAWSFSSIMWRANPDEHDSLAAFEAVGLRHRLTVALRQAPYRYYLYGKPLQAGTAS